MTKKMGGPQRTHPMMAVNDQRPGLSFEPSGRFLGKAGQGNQFRGDDSAQREFILFPAVDQPEDWACRVVENGRQVAWFHFPFFFGRQQGIHGSNFAPPAKDASGNAKFRFERTCQRGIMKERNLF